jgi:excinuclease UvrABC nuclease subunit
MEILNKYQTKGSFTFFKGERLSSKCGAIPNEPGVYLIYAIKNLKKDLVYIGASGKMNQDGSFKVQKLKKRIQNMQNSTTSRQSYFENKIQECNLDSIEVEWFVTFVDDQKDLPLNIEGTLLQLYFDKNGVLPCWNNQA